MSYPIFHVVDGVPVDFSFLFGGKGGKMHAP